MIIEHTVLDITVGGVVYKSDVFKDTRNHYLVTVKCSIPHHGFGKACVEAVESLYNAKAYWYSPSLISNFKEQVTRYEKES